MTDTIEDQLRRKTIVCENLAQRLGVLMGENIELLVRIHDLEQAATPPPDEGASQ